LGRLQATGDISGPKPAPFKAAEEAGDFKTFFSRLPAAQVI